ncbi:hypothetical protein IC582_018602 [Cucumis melo]
MSDYYTSSLLPSRRGRNHKELQLAGFRGVWRSGIQEQNDEDDTTKALMSKEKVESLGLT